MKKFVSIFLAACAMSAMSVTAFARQADAVNVMSDESLKLSFGEETFEQLIQPGQSYTYPLYLEQEGGKLVPLTDEHLEDLRLRAETKNGRSVLSSFEVEKEGDRYQLEVTAQAGWADCTDRSGRNGQGGQALQRKSSRKCAGGDDRGLSNHP